MPPVFGISAPKCPRCGKSVYIAEQVIGPNSTPYHKPCLACVTCNKRLDSTLLVEHDGLPLCKNCHRNHLGQGKGGFGKAVPVRANLPVSPDRKKETQEDGNSENDDDEMVRRLTGINIRPREAPVAASPSTPPPAIAPSDNDQPARPRGDWSQITSLDDLVSSSSDVPRIQPRSEVMRRQVDDIYNGVGVAQSVSTAPSRTMPATPPPKPVSLRSVAPTTQAQSAITPTSTPTSRNDVSATPITPTPRNDGLPAPVRRTPGSSTTSTYKTAPAPSPSSFPASSPNRLTTSINSGTPLCARCSKAVYHAEQVTAASGNRVWHRPCLRCDVCSRTLQKGQLEEGPTLLSGDMTHPPLAPNNADSPCNIYCRVCFKKYFGPRGIGAAGMSFPVQ